MIVAAPGEQIEWAAMLGYLELRLARYKIPKSFSVMDALPRNAAGKILKTVLRASLARQPLSKMSADANNSAS